MIACDVVLLPPGEIMDKAVELNKELIKRTGNTDIILDKVGYLPHITLAMGCVDKENLERIDSILKSIAKDVLPIRLKTIPLNDETASIKIEKNRDIELLHELVMIRMNPFFVHDVSKEMIYNWQSEEISDITLDYISKFPTRSCFENYVPHITVGRGDMTGIELESLEFEARDLALCHLGDFCTCRKILFSYT
ncbi:MAG: hypothetical protein PVH45_02590 [Candidatus Omnitrophota bacterium]|jgi:2'-5' RNA ligase